MNAIHAVKASLENIGVQFGKYRKLYGFYESIKLPADVDLFAGLAALGMEPQVMGQYRCTIDKEEGVYFHAHVDGECLDCALVFSAGSTTEYLLMVI